jgi:hypothetical protein
MFTLFYCRYEFILAYKFALLTPNYTDIRFILFRIKKILPYIKTGLKKTVFILLASILKLWNYILPKIYLTFKNRASYNRTGVSLPSRCCILYIFATTISTEYFKHAAHSPFFSSKCRLFHNTTILVHVLFTFYIQGELKFKCKI